MQSTGWAYVTLPQDYYICPPFNPACATSVAEPARWVFPIVESTLLACGLGSLHLYVSGRLRKRLHLSSHMGDGMRIKKRGEGVYHEASYLQSYTAPFQD